MKWIGTQTIYDNVRLVKSLHIMGDLFVEAGTLYGSGSGAGNLPIIAGDITVYNAVNDGDPTISLGSSATERLEIKAQYESGAQGLDAAVFTTYTAGSATSDGRFTFFVDEVGTFQIRDHGINLYANKSLQIGSTDIISDSGGTATLSNIDALDATTIATFNAALTAGDITGVTAGTGLSGGGTSGAVTLNVEASQTQITAVGTIATGVWQGTSITTTYTAAKVTSVVAGDGIDVSGATGDVTVTAETASDSNPGVVELATTGEADTGTDTARAVTPAGLKSHIDARYAFSYLHFACQSTMLSSGNWVGPSGNGLNHHVWNLDYGVNTETNDTSEAAISRIYAQSGIRMPVACVIDGFSGMSRNAGGDRQVTVGLFLSRAADSNLVPFGTTTTTRPKLQCHADTNNDSGDYSNKAVHYEVTGANLAMAAGDVLYPAIKLTGVTSSGDTDSTYSTITIAFKTLIA